MLTAESSRQRRGRARQRRTLALRACTPGGWCSGARRALPSTVERALDLHDPDDEADERDEVPEAGDAADRLVEPCSRVHVADLRRQQEPVDDADQYPDHEADDPAD